MKVLVTGSAGFVGFHVTKSLLDRGDQVVGVDNFNDYYDVDLKEARNEILIGYDNFKSYKVDISDHKKLNDSLGGESIDKIIHLAAQAGVRYSIDHPFVYERSNLDGFLNILEFARRSEIETLIYASSSSVYGNNKKIPFSEDDNVDTPISLYAATKKANELMAYTYHHLYGLKVTGMRIFTAYGPWSRPDMALYKFVKNISEDRPIEIYNHGKMKRDFTYIDDLVDGVLRCLDKSYECEIFNLGRGKAIKLMDFVHLIEKYMEKDAKKIMKEMQPGDVPITYSDTSKAKKMLGYDPKISIEEGVKRFVEWFRGYMI